MFNFDLMMQKNIRPMKYLGILLLLLFVSCRQNENSAINNKNSVDKKNNSIDIKAVSKAVINTEGKFYYPQYFEDSTKIFFTTANYKGIWFYSLPNRKVTKITGDENSGYSFIYLPKTNSVFYISKTLNEKRRNIYSIEQVQLKNLAAQQIINSNKNLSGIKVKEDILTFFEDGQPRVFNLKNDNFSKISTIKDTLYKIDENKLYKITADGKEEIYAGENNLIWLDSGKDGKKIIFYETSKGEILLEGDSTKFLGDFRNAKLSPDEKYLVYMIDKDDGHKIVSSDIYITELENPGNSFNITGSENIIEMNPCWNSNGKEIAYNTNEGKIITVKLKFYK